jgi:peptidoglycan/xylan/chitin deacetylase (PgdA/CDA1 family)
MVMRRLLPVLLLLVSLPGGALEPIPDKTVVLTFDDAVKSHLTFVAPMLAELDFGATFFVTHCWMQDTENFMSWQDIRHLHDMGFEIGNHTWSHANFAGARNQAKLAGQLALVENELKKVGVPKPVSFAWPGNFFPAEGAAQLRSLGYRLARRGMQPEIPYGRLEPGPLYDPLRHDPLLIPSAGDAYPEWTMENFRAAVDRAAGGKIAVVQFHGVPDIAHPWVHTPPAQFAQYMRYLKENGFNVIAMRDLLRYVDPAAEVDDAFRWVRYQRGSSLLELPAELMASRQDAPFWLENMLVHHRYTPDEAAQVLGWQVKEVEAQAKLLPQVPQFKPAPDAILTLPYPGGRHPRIGFLDGAIDPLRGTKISLFPPWTGGGYVVLDVPEAIFSNLGLLFLAHTHVPTIWDEQNLLLENVDWRRQGADWSHTRELPNGTSFGATITPREDGADIDLWLDNNTPESLTKLRTQVCLMLKGAPGFEAQEEAGRSLGHYVAAIKAADADRYILVGFQHCGKTWGNIQCPCIHSDPVLPDAAPDQMVRVRGQVRFYEGTDVAGEIAAMERALAP